MKTPIFGPSYTEIASSNLAYNQCVNLFPSGVVAKGAGKEVGALYNTPGLTLKFTCGAGPVRWMQEQGNTLVMETHHRDQQAITILANST